MFGLKLQALVTLPNTNDSSNELATTQGNAADADYGNTYMVIVNKRERVDTVMGS